MRLPEAGALGRDGLWRWREEPQPDAEHRAFGDPLQHAVLDAFDAPRPSRQPDPSESCEAWDWNCQDNNGGTSSGTTRRHRTGTTDGGTGGTDAGTTTGTSAADGGTTDTGGNGNGNGNGNGEASSEARPGSARQAALHSAGRPTRGSRRTDVPRAAAPLGAAALAVSTVPYGRMCGMPSAEDTSVHQERPVVRPTQQDEIAAAGSELIGGPVGTLGADRHRPAHPRARRRAGGDRDVRARHGAEDCPATTGRGSEAPARSTRTPATPTFRTSSSGVASPTASCRTSTGCSGDMQYLEYPVLTGVFMEVASWLTPGGSMQYREQMYWMVNAGMLMICAAVIAVCVARTHRRRPWDGLLVALAPAFALTATINWDLLAVALTAAAMLMWSRGAGAGVRHPHRPRHGRQALSRAAAGAAASCSAGGRANGGSSAWRRSARPAPGWW